MLLQSAASAANAFNLVCAGMMMPLDRSAAPEPINFELRIDLDAKRWCRGDCSETIPIQAVGETVILLEAYELGALFISTTVNRESGNYESKSEASIGGRPAGNAIFATCERAPFTGFPARKF